MKIVGHRGAKGVAPENTLVGFAKAIKLGVDEIEFDVRVTKDHVPVLSHDAVVHDQAGNALPIKDTAHAVLLIAKPDLATLDSALSFIDTRVRLMIEVKPDEPIKPVAKVIHEYLDSGMYHASDLLFASFSQKTLLALKHEFPDVQSIVIENWSSIRARRRAKELGTTRVNMLEYWLWGGFIHAVKRSGWELYSFPPKKDRPLVDWLLGGHTNNLKKARKWAKAGLTGVITDYPDRFKK